MMRDIAVGVCAGAVSWGICSMFGRFEPFDTTPGLFVGQGILSTFAAYWGYKFKARNLFILLTGMYVGMNSYAYLFGSSEARAWAGLGLITSTLLVVVPLVVAILSHIIRQIRDKNWY